jgi:methyl-accepting chemotaxis protein
MIKVLGLIILLYGVAGVIGSYLVYRALQAPISRLRDELNVLAGRLARAGGSVNNVTRVLVDKIKPALTSVAGELGTIAYGIGLACGYFGEQRDQLRQSGTNFRAFKIPMLTATPPHREHLDLDVTLDLVTGVSLAEYTIPYVDFKVYGPPMKTTTQSTTVLDLGSYDVITWLDIQDRSPLEPVAAAFDLVADKVEEVRQQFSDTKVEIENTRGFVDEQATAVSDASRQLGDLSRDLETAREQLGNLSRSRWLNLAPLGVIGYFGLMHLAFALTGVALLLG